VLNGFEPSASVDEQERASPSVASGNMSWETFTEWLAPRVRSVV
jgi:hypothetical protein